MTNPVSSIDQLKRIRAEAVARLRESQDFKLAGRLGALIVELGETLDDQSALSGLDTSASEPRSSSPFAPKPVTPVAPIAASSPSAPVESSDADAEDADDAEILDELVAEIKNDMADLDRSSASASSEGTADNAKGATVKPFIGRYANGSADEAKSGLAG